MVVVVVVFVFIGVNKLFVWLFYDMFMYGECEVCKGYVFVLQEYLDCVDCIDFVGCDVVIVCLNKNVWEKFDIVDLDIVLDFLVQQWCDLVDYKFVLMINGKDYYLLLYDGVVLYVYSVDMDYFGIQLIVYLLIVIVVLLLLLFWVWMYWCDLCVLEDVVCGFGVGNLVMCVNLCKCLNVYVLVCQFDEMVECIQGLIQYQCEMMNGILYELKMLIVWLEFGIVLLQLFELEVQCNVWFDVLCCDVCELDELVSELLVLSCLEQGVMYFVLMCVVVGEWFDSVVVSVVNDVVDCQFILVVYVDIVFVYYVCDLCLLVCVLFNLICNVVCYVGNIIIICVEVGFVGVLCLMVEDDGFGIFELDCVCVFELFLCLDVSCDCYIGGFGLGLVIVWCIVLVYGGDVCFDVVMLGGVCFVVLLFVMMFLLLQVQQDVGVVGVLSVFVVWLMQKCVWVVVECLVEYCRKCVLVVVVQFLCYV